MSTQSPARALHAHSLAEIDPACHATFGGKACSLALMAGLVDQGPRVPAAFVLGLEAWRAQWHGTGLDARVRARLDELDDSNELAREAAGAELREWIVSTPLIDEVEAAAREAYAALSERAGAPATDVAVRSSLIAEGMPESAVAGHQESFLNVRGWQALDLAIRRCMASLFTNRAMAFRAEHGVPTDSLAVAVIVQKMVRSDLACSGLVLTHDPESGFRDVVIVKGSWGLGETMARGWVDADEYQVHKPTLEAGHAPLLRRERGEKAIRCVYETGGTERLRVEAVPRVQRERFVLADAEVLRLARWALAVERRWSEVHGRAEPLELEWAKDGPGGELALLQARPAAVARECVSGELEVYTITPGAAPIVTGRSVGARVGAGPVRLVHGPEQLSRFEPGEVLVAEMTDPDWEPVLARAAAVVTDRGGRSCHAAGIARELGIPCVVGTRRGTALLRDGQPVTVSCAEGDEGRVYGGVVHHERHRIRPDEVPRPSVDLMLILSDPDLAWSLSRLPAAGVGLMRIEFLVGHWIGMHPMACAHPDRVSDPDVRAAILRRARGWGTPGEFFVERMASGIAVLAAAFWPRPVTVRFSDFKSNEYAHLLGGADFEPVETNPTLGFRGASRYDDVRYADGFALECAAIRRVRDAMGLTNVRVMVPFCRTLTEGRRVLAALERHGLRRGSHGLEVWVMCETPSNVVLADGFADLFDGFSIGSNDLTQLTLGIDRDSALLAEQFSERDPAVQRMIASVIERAHRAKRPVCLCGQAPSDDALFAQWLVAVGVDSLSLTPDALPEVAARLAEVD